MNIVDARLSQAMWELKARELGPQLGDLKSKLEEFFGNFVLNLFPQDNVCDILWMCLRPYEL